jgi:hypothetical protein
MVLAVLENHRQVIHRSGVCHRTVKAETPEYRAKTPRCDIFSTTQNDRMTLLLQFPGGEGFQTRRSLPVCREVLVQSASAGIEKPPEMVQIYACGRR